MDNQTGEDIIEMARQQIAVRKEHVIEERGQRELPWRYAFFGMVIVLLLGVLAWPSSPRDDWSGTTAGWNMYAVVHGVCAQVHNVELGGMQLPLCARNTGIYSSFLLTCIYLAALGRSRAAKLPSIPITITLVLLIMIMAVDGFNSMLRDMFLPNLYMPRNDLRTLTGIGMGTALGVLLWLVINISLRRNPDTETRIIGSWLELGGILAINMVVLIAIYSNIAIMFWPIAIIAWLGIVGILFLVNLLIIALVMRYEGNVLRIIQLARPATIALVFTLLELASMSAGRFWLEAQGMILN